MELLIDLIIAALQFIIASVPIMAPLLRPIIRWFTSDKLSWDDPNWIHPMEKIRLEEEARIRSERES